MKGCFFFFSSITLSHATKKFVIFPILFVALSHCNKDLFCLSHWFTATNRFFICCTESLIQTKFVYFAKKVPKQKQMLHFFPFLVSFVSFWHKLCLFVFKKMNFCHVLASFWQIIVIFCRSDSVQQTKNVFVTGTQCNEQNKFLSQRFGATNNIEKKCNFFVACDKKIEEEKSPFKFEFHHRYQIALGYMSCKTALVAL